jgi:hypothetical protein
MARRITCPQCHQEFTTAQYHIHKFTHLRDQFLQKDPVDPSTSKLLPIEVSDDSDESMEDVFDVSAQSMDHHLSPDDDPFSDNHKSMDNSLPYTDAFSDVIM